MIVGSSGPETENLKVQIAKLALQKQVLLLSAIDDSQLCWLYQNCQLFVIPSSTEGFCLPLAEALYFSRPVVCSDIPIFREIGQNNCTYFELEENPVQNCVRAIAKSLESSKQHQKSAGFLFSIDNARKQYLNFSRSVL
jgi:glycosyltransferase involved in cell wall biosynthesis